MKVIFLRSTWNNIIELNMMCIMDGKEKQYQTKSDSLSHWQALFVAQPGWSWGPDYLLSGVLQWGDSAVLRIKNCGCGCCCCFHCRRKEKENDEDKLREKVQWISSENWWSSCLFSPIFFSYEVRGETIFTLRGSRFQSRNITEL